MVSETGAGVSDDRHLFQLINDFVYGFLHCFWEVAVFFLALEEATDSSDLSYDCWELWMVTQDNTAPIADRDEAAAQLISKAESGDCPGHIVRTDFRSQRTA